MTRAHTQKDEDAHTETRVSRSVPSQVEVTTGPVVSSVSNFGGGTIERSKTHTYSLEKSTRGTRLFQRRLEKYAYILSSSQRRHPPS